MLIQGSLVKYQTYVKNPAFNGIRSESQENPRYSWQPAGEAYFHSIQPVGMRDEYAILAILETNDGRLVECPIDRIQIINAATYTAQIVNNYKQQYQQLLLCRKLLADLDAAFDGASLRGLAFPMASRIKEVLEEISK